MLPIGTLTSREIEVLYLLAAGYSSKIIADELGISKRTVEKHIENILAKLLAPNAPAAISISIKAKVIDPAKIAVIQILPPTK